MCVPTCVVRIEWFDWSSVHAVPAGASSGGRPARGRRRPRQSQSPAAVSCRVARSFEKRKHVWEQNSDPLVHSRVRPKRARRSDCPPPILTCPQTIPTNMAEAESALSPSP